MNKQQLLAHPDKPWQPWPVKPWLGAIQTHSLIDTGLCYQQQPCYAAELIDEYHQGLTLTSLRQHLGSIDDHLYLLGSKALQLNLWRQQHQFCGQCGSPIERLTTEMAYQCHRCSLDFYPRISPCIIVLLTQGEYCLLAHHQHHSDVMYPALAGFVEAGESLEQTLHREVKEEVGLSASNVRYFGSQSWPFPGQLMVGYTAEGGPEDIVIDEDEIADARWFHYTDLPVIPPIYTLSGQLIHSFVNSHDI